MVLRVIAERLANATVADELLALSSDLIAIAGVVAEEARCDAPAASCGWYSGNRVIETKSRSETWPTPMHFRPSQA